MSEPRRSAGTWLSGARAAGVDLGYPGQRLGLPQEGPGAVAGYGRRLVALVIDWFLAMLVAQALAAVFGWNSSTRSLATLLIFGGVAKLAVGIFGTTIGKRLAGLRVARVGGGRVGFMWAGQRAVLLILLIPAVIWDRDRRGLHDRAARTVVVNR